MSKLKAILSGVISLLYISVGFTSCSQEDEGYTYPSLLSEFADVCTDEFGVFTHLLTDSGERLCIANSAEIKANSVTPDTIYRTLSRYELVDGGAKLYSLQAIPAPEALPHDAFPEGVKADAVEMQSIWRGGDYLNMILLVKAQDGKHSFHFVEDSITLSSTGVTTLYLRLYHDAGNDVQAYTQKAYLSVPLQPYKSILSLGDSICFSIPTNSGWQNWKRAY
ncbi:MAG: hypothetical protein IKY31_09080 [Bacteroidaceae bacterium]|nr:hypothetical protein [Bacteroidaceae bacterium]